MTVEQPDIDPKCCHFCPFRCKHNLPLDRAKKGFIHKVLLLVQAFTNHKHWSFDTTTGLVGQTNSDF